MKCPRCGARIRDDALECSSCGIWLDDVPETPLPSNKPLLIAMAVVLTALLIVTFLAFTGKFSDQKQTPVAAAAETEAVTTSEAELAAPTATIAPTPTAEPTASPTPTPTPAPTETPAPTATPTPAALPGHYILPGSDSRYLDESELEGLSDRDLMLARNEIFARHGFIFSTDWLQGYFLTQGWYRGTTTASQFDAGVFNSFERANVDLILRVEAEREG